MFNGRSCSTNIGQISMGVHPNWDPLESSCYFANRNQPSLKLMLVSSPHRAGIHHNRHLQFSITNSLSLPPIKLLLVSCAVLERPLRLSSPAALTCRIYTFLFIRTTNAQVVTICMITEFLLR